MSIISLLIYIPLQIAFIPVAIFGILLTAYKQLVVSRKLGISQTAIEVIQGRYTMHMFGMREDHPTAKLVAVLPNASMFGLWLVLFPLWVKFKISGRQSFYPRQPEPGSENFTDLIIARTLYFDCVIERVLPQLEQFVVMGAGYDTRAYGEFQREGISFFELDQAEVQQQKRAALEQAGIPSDHVSFVSIDFTKEGAFERLMESGYDSSKKTLFLWEGVTLYLSEADVRKTMQDIRSKAADGSILLTDIYGERWMAFTRKAVVEKSLEYTDEGMGFSLQLSSDYEKDLSQFVKSESMTVGETFYMGYKDKKGPYVVVAEIIK